MWFDFGFFDIGINDWPYPHDVNIYDRMLEIMPLDIIVSLPLLFISITGIIYGLIIIKEFIKGYKG
ncbi:MAG: hypothetical protein A2W19_09320 [Spirochaetes bacterium RBG_16_49_21]|nr:MAG: hypothetical protein A2W19_09320 [Spirochaetes bacterium RBG_16_49_21]